MTMNRREFGKTAGAIVGAGVLFPRELLAAPKPRPAQQEGHYPLYYMREEDPSRRFDRSKDVFQLWQPGIIFGVASDIPDCDRPASCYLFPSVLHEGELDLYNAILLAQPHSLIVDDGFGRPYKASGDFWCHNEHGPRPVVLGLDKTETLTAHGHLRRCKPFCTFDEWLRKYQGEKK